MKLDKTNIKKTYYDAAECLLNTIPITSKRIAELKDQIRFLPESNIQGIDYSTERVQTSGISKSTELIALHNLSKKEVILKQIAEEEILIFRYKKALEILDANQQLIVQLRYFKNIPWESITDHLNYSRRQCIRIRDEAVATLAYYFYGPRALKHEIPDFLSKNELC